MTVTVMQPSHRAATDLAAVLFTTRSRFFARCLAEAELVAEFSRHSSEAEEAHAQMINAAVPTCATTWKLNWRKQLLGRTNRLKSRNSIRATNAAAAEPN